MPGSGILSEELLPWDSRGLWRSVHGRPSKLGWPFTTVQWKHTKRNHGLNHWIHGWLHSTDLPRYISRCDWWLSVYENPTCCYVTMYAPTNSRTSDHAEFPASPLIEISNSPFLFLEFRWYNMTLSATFRCIRCIRSFMYRRSAGSCWRVQAKSLR